MASEWPLQGMLDELRIVDANPLDHCGVLAEGCSLEETGLARYRRKTHKGEEIHDWELTPAGAALLSLLEIEHCKRRIEAAGWRLRVGPYDVGGIDSVAITPQNAMGWSEFSTLEAAAEYAEAHAQEEGHP